MTDRKGDYIQCFLGGKFWTIDPRPEEIFIEDIAHGLGMMCRYNGQCNRFESVAEHSVHIARYLRSQGEVPDIQLHGLLHDAPEAYIADINRPTKPHLTNYRELESNIMSAVCRRFNLMDWEPPQVKSADNRILVDEHQQNMKHNGDDWSAKWGPALGITLEYWSPEIAKQKFLQEYAIIQDLRDNQEHALIELAKQAQELGLDAA